MRTVRFSSALAVAFTLAAASVAPLSAQSVEEYGFTAGLSRATLAGGFTDFVSDRGGNPGARIGFALGGYAHVALNEAFTLRPELMFVQRGNRIPAENGVRRRDLDLDYIDVSALVRRHFPVGDLQGWVGGGATVSLLAGSGGRVGEVTIDDVSDEIEGTDFGVALEAGADRGRFGFGLRYSLGLANISTSPDSDESANNRSLMLLVSYAVR